jgi:hypothetical protein
MSIWSAIFKSKNKTGVDPVARAVGVLKDQGGWYYEESQDFSSTQSTIRVEQRRPGNWKVRENSCGIVGLNNPGRRDEVARFFAGTYRWLRLERDGRQSRSSQVIKIIGTYRDKAGKEHPTHLGFLNEELAEELKAEDVAKLWGRIRFIKFPVPGRDSKFLIRFDLMECSSPKRTSG